MAFASVFSFLANKYFPPVRSSWRFFPDSKGIISGLIVSAYGFSGMFLNFIATLVINPDRKKAVPVPGSTESYYEKEVVDRVPIYLLGFSIFILCVGTLSTLLISTPTVVAADDKISSTNTAKEDKLLENDVEKPNEEKQTVVRAVVSRKFAVTFIMTVFSMYFPYFVYNVQFKFASISIENYSNKDFLSILASCANGSARLLFGYLSDKFSFRALYTVVLVISV